MKIPQEDKILIIENLQQYLLSEFQEEVGTFAAENLLQHILDLVTPYIYNKAIADARTTALQQLERTDEELSFLEMPLKKR